MKKKSSRILGVGLALVLVLALAVTVVPTNTPNTTEAAVGKLRFGTIPLPKFGADGNHVLTPVVDVGPIAVTPGGSVMFASANTTPSANLTSVLKSSDGVYTWWLQTGFRTAADLRIDTTSIVDILAQRKSILFSRGHICLYCLILHN